MHVNVFIQVHSGQRDGRVHVICGGYDYGVNVFLAAQHLAIILIVLGFRPMLALQANHPVEPLLSLHAVELNHGNARDGLRIGLVKPRLQSLNVHIKMLKGFAGVVPIHIAEGDDVLGGQVDKVGAANTADSDTGNI